jgi:Ser/Thr protein kinase RdoA (MazF antagonist)
MATDLSKLSSGQLKTVLEEHFLFKIKKVKRLSGFYDANFSIDTDKGKRFVKVYGVDTLASITFQIDLIERLNKSGISVGRIVKTAGGEGYFPVLTTHGIVQTFLRGKHVDEKNINTTLLENLGAMLGKIHHATKGKKFKGKVWKVYPWDLSQFSITAANLPSVKKYLSPEAFSMCEQVVADWRKERTGLARLKKGIAHNDFHGRNILVERNRCVGITDFGDSMLTWYAADIGVALMHLCFFSSRPRRNIDAFLKGYSRRFQLSALERKHLPLLIRMRAYLVAVEIANQFKGTPPTMYRKFFKYAINVLKMLPENLDF